MSLLAAFILGGVGIGPNAPSALACCLPPQSSEGDTFHQLAKSETPNGAVTRGKFRVFEDRAAGRGRALDLDFVILHARSTPALPDPLFFFAGGPGMAATQLRPIWERHWIRDRRDIVLIDQRGTGGNHQLAFQFQEEGQTLQQYFDPLMDEGWVRDNLARLSKQADLSMYSTPQAMDDVNAFRQALGYSSINLLGGSYGTRACLIFLRRHGEHVRTATLEGCAPLAFRNPLYHAAGAQRALDLLFQEAASTPRYREAFGDLKNTFAEIRARLRERPAEVRIRNQTTGEVETVTMNEAAFLEAVRFQMYSTATSRRLPRLLVEAHRGDFRAFMVESLQQSMNLRRSLALGMLLSVTAAEDLARIDPAEIEPLTAGTFLGDVRVRTQLAAGRLWPQAKLPANFGMPVRSEVPTLIVSGLIDPVTPPEWGEVIRRNFPNSVHVMAPRAHDLGGGCLDAIQRQFLESADVDALQLDCVESMTLPPLELPSQRP